MTKIDAKSKDLKSVNAEIRRNLNGTPVNVSNANHLHGLAAGIKHGEIVINGSSGNYLGVLNAGATIRVEENVGKYAADNMNQGVVIISGDADYGAGMYCYGGTLVIYGNAGDFTSSMNKGATIIVKGDVGDEAGTYMLAGDFIVVGNAGKNFANYLIRGNVYLGGDCESYGHNTRIEDVSEDDIEKLKAYFETYEIKADPASFKKLVAASEKPFYH